MAEEPGLDSPVQIIAGSLLGLSGMKGSSKNSEKCNLFLPLLHSSTSHHWLPLRVASACHCLTWMKWIPAWQNGKVGLASHDKADQHYFLPIGHMSQYPQIWRTGWCNNHFRQCPVSSLTTLSLALTTLGMLTTCILKSISCILTLCSLAQTVLSAQNALPQLVNHYSTGQAYSVFLPHRIQMPLNNGHVGCFASWRHNFKFLRNIS